jgi:hypothetical protein
MPMSKWWKLSARRTWHVAAVCVLLGFVTVSARAADGQTDDGGVAKVAMLLGGTTYPYKTIADGVWTIDFMGKSLASYRVLAGADKGTLTAFAVIAKAGQFTASTELMTMLLKLNTSLNSVRVAYDADGDLIVETKLPIRLLDVAELKNKIDEVAGSADMIYESIGTYLVKQ